MANINGNLTTNLNGLKALIDLANDGFQNQPLQRQQQIQDTITNAEKDISDLVTKTEQLNADLQNSNAEIKKLEKERDELLAENAALTKKEKSTTLSKDETKTYITKIAMTKSYKDDLLDIFKESREFFNKLNNIPQSRAIINNIRAAETFRVPDNMKINKLYEQLADYIKKNENEIINASASPRIESKTKAIIDKVTTGGDVRVKFAEEDDTSGTRILSSNDVAGLLLQSKRIYMRLAYLQLIQTLSNLAERKSFKSLKFDKPNIGLVLQQIKSLSGSTIRLLEQEEEQINNLCINILKDVDPKIDDKDILEKLNVDRGKYPFNGILMAVNENAIV